MRGVGVMEMNCNNIVNMARQYCIERSAQYKQQYFKAGMTGFVFYKYLATDELLYWVETLIDKDFDNDDTCVRALISFTNHFTSDSLTSPPNALAKKYVNDEKQNYIGYVSKLTSNCRPISLPYSRTITGEEKIHIREKLAERWNYHVGSYWDPLNETTKDETLFIMHKYMAQHQQDLSKSILNVYGWIFRYGEGFIERYECVQADWLNFEYSGRETIYTNRDTTWVIYLSHEGTVTFAGEILPNVKNILSDQQSKWNKFDIDAKR